MDDHLGPVEGLAGQLPPQVTRSATLTYTVDASDLPGPLTNTVVVTGTVASGAMITRTHSASTVLVMPLLNWTPSTYTVGEGSGSFTATVIMSPTNPYTQTTVEVKIVDSLGLSPVGTQIITFPPNSDSRSIAINVVDDKVVTARTLQLTLQAPRGAGLGSMHTAHVTIIENDVALDLQVTKSANTLYAVVGQHIVYTVHITNTGVDAIIISNAVDDKLGTVAGLIGNLAPNASRTVSLSYVVQESDLPGPLVNTVVVTGNNGAGHTIVRSAAASVRLDALTINLPHIRR